MVRSASMRPLAPASARRRRAASGSSRPTAWLTYAIGTSGTFGRARWTRAISSSERSKVRAAPQGDRAAAPERGSVGKRVRVREPELEHVGAGIDGRQRRRQARLGVGIAGHDVGDERGPTRRCRVREPHHYLRRAGGRVRAGDQGRGNPLGSHPHASGLERAEVLVAAP